MLICKIKKLGSKAKIFNLGIAIRRRLGFDDSDCFDAQNTTIAKIDIQIATIQQ
jgi:hypothetical protein